MSAQPGGSSRVPARSGEGQNQAMLWDLDLLTADDVCTLLKVKKSWLYDTVEAGAIDVVRLGKQLRFRPSAIAAYVAGRAQSQESALAQAASESAALTRPGRPIA